MKQFCVFYVNFIVLKCTGYWDVGLQTVGSIFIVLEAMSEGHKFGIFAQFMILHIVFSMKCNGITAAWARVN